MDLYQISRTTPVPGTRTLARCASLAAVMLLMPAGSASAVEEAGVGERYSSEILPFCQNEWEFGSFEGVDGVEIAYATYRVHDSRGSLVILPGRTEPLIKYCELVFDLVDLGYSVYLMDHRGQGGSGRMLVDPNRQFVVDFQDFVDDVATFVDEVVSAEGRPDSLVLFGHSLGGLIATNYAEQNPDSLDALILSAPSLQIQLAGLPEPLAYVLAVSATALGLGSDYIPGAGPPVFDAPFETNLVTRSRARYDAYQTLLAASPELAVGGTTFRFVRESIEASFAARLFAPLLTTPTLLLQAGDDRYVENSAGEMVCAVASDCSLVRFEGAFHELFQEQDAIRDRAIDELRAFIEAH